MCGIFGAINLCNFFEETDFKRFVKLTDLVTYRGPDASGYIAISIKEQSINNRDRFDVFLGHRRLSIIDPSCSANQPLTDGNGTWIIYNGEIFNYIELRKELKEKGQVFKTQGDTEVILKVYRQYGVYGFEKLNGMWAFAIVDLTNRKIILSRDRFSIKPLYVTWINNMFYFASEIKQLLPILEKRTINENVMFSFIEQGLLDYNKETFYKEIHKLKPKCSLIIQIDTGKIEEHKYWDYHLQEEVYSNDYDSVEQFRELLEDSVNIRLRSDFKTGALLSGGLDSSTIAIICNESQSGNFETYSIVSKNEKYSEEKFIDILSSHNGVKNYKLYLESDEVISGLDDVIYHNDEPIGGFSVIAQYKILETIKKNTDLKVILNGQGGDEILAGYLKFFFFNIKDLITRGHFINALCQILQSLIKRTVIWQFNIGEAKRYIPFSTSRIDKKFLLIKGVIEPIYDCTNLKEKQILDIDKYSIPALTHYLDRNSMAHSIETREPFLDHRLVNFAVNLPAKIKLNEGWTKCILRKAFPDLPEAIRWRRDKQGFIIPEEAWVKKDLHNLIHNVFSKSVLGKMGIIDDKLFLRYYQKFQNGNKVIWHKDISRVLFAELWARKFMT